MTKFLDRRKMTWALALWSVYIATWTALSGPGPTMVALWWLVGIALLGALSVVVLSDWALIALARNGAAGTVRAATSLTYLALVYVTSRVLVDGRLDAFASARVVSRRAQGGRRISMKPSIAI